MLTSDGMHSDKPQWHKSQNPAQQSFAAERGDSPVKLDDRRPEVGSDPKNGALGGVIRDQ
jgi:hypothetical protein